MNFIRTGNLSYAIGVSETSFNIVDALVYAISGIEINSANDDLIDAHELMQSELGRQQNDWLDLKSSPLGNFVTTLRSRSTGVSVANNYWYPSGY